MTRQAESKGLSQRDLVKWRGGIWGHRAKNPQGKSEHEPLQDLNGNKHHWKGNKKKKPRVK